MTPVMADRLTARRQKWPTKAKKNHTQRPHALFPGKTTFFRPIFVNR
jgi:hypothetical protein